MFEVFEHTADVGLRIEADSLENLFVDAARGLTSLLVANLDALAPVVEKGIAIESEAKDLLLFDWLNELLFLFETEHLMFCRFVLEMSTSSLEDGHGGPDASPHAGATQLVARCLGEKMDRKKHQMEHEVKAITYHDLHVQPTASGWQAQVILDI